MKETEEVLLINLKEFFQEAEGAFRRGKYNTAVVLYFKALSELCDLILWRKLRRIGTSHSKRFRLLEIKEPYLYKVCDLVFTRYRETYSKIITKRQAEEVREYVKKAIEKFKIKF